MYEDRRQYMRQKLEAQVRYGLVDGKEHRSGRLVDISLGGACLESPALLRTGSVIQVQFQGAYPDGDALAVRRIFRARVRWTKDLGDNDRTRYNIGMEYL